MMHVRFDLTFDLYTRWKNHTIPDLDFSPKRLESIINRGALQYRILDLVIHRNQLRHDFQHLIQQLVRNGHDAFQWVAEYDVSLYLLAGREGMRNEGRTYRGHSHPTHIHRYIPRTGLSFCAATHGRSTMSPDLSVRQPLHSYQHSREEDRGDRRKTHRNLTPRNLPQIPNPPINNYPTNTNTLHPHRHNPTQNRTALTLRLIDHGNRARLRPVDPVRAGGEAVFVFRGCFGGWEGSAGFGDEFEGRGWGDDLGVGFVAADGGGEGDCYVMLVHVML